MPFDGNGIYNPISPPDFPAEPGTLIRASQYNNQILDMSSALSNCLTRDGQGKPTADINMNGFKLEGLGVGTDPADAVRFDQVTDIVQADWATQGITLNNSVAFRGKNTGGTVLNLIYVGADNNIYFGTTGANWYMRFNASLNRVEFNSNTRVAAGLDVTGNFRAGGNVAGFVPGL